MPQLESGSMSVVVLLQTCNRRGRYKLSYMYRFKQNVKLYWCSSIKYSKWHHCRHVNAHLEYFNQVKKKKVIVWDNYLQLFDDDKAPGVQYSWYNVLLSAGPKFLKERKGWSHSWLNGLESHALVEFANLFAFSRLYPQTFLASRIGCKTTIFLSLHQWHTDHRLSRGWGEGNVGNQRIPWGLI